MKAAKMLSGTIAQFAVDVLRQVKSEDPNVLFSPFSISAALAMVYAGAKHNTARQMKQSLFKAVQGDKTLKIGFKQIVKILNQMSDAYDLRTANRLYTDLKFESVIFGSYIDTLTSWYHSTIKAIELEPPAAKEINNWVEEQTNGRIKNLVSPASLKPSGSSVVALLIVNAIYFKGDWKVPFQENSTKKKPFFFGPNGKTEVQMMRSFYTSRASARKIFGYYEERGIQILKIPYKKDLTMFIFLPTALYGLNEFEKGISGQRLLQLISKSHKKEYAFVAVPKFKMETKYRDLVKTIKKLGAIDMFNQKAADFGKMMKIRNQNGRKIRDVWVSDIVHKAFIEVNEKGAEAAAATAIIVRSAKRSKRAHKPPPPPRPKIFIADHPFLFLIQDTRTDAILFLGRYFAGEKVKPSTAATPQKLTERQRREKKIESYFGEIPGSKRN